MQRFSIKRISCLLLSCMGPPNDNRDHKLVELIDLLKIGHLIGRPTWGPRIYRPIPIHCI